MKRILLFVLAFVFLFAPMSVFSEGDNIYYVNFTWLNVRKGPGLIHEKIHELKRNDEVVVLSKENFEWYKIRFEEDKIGYVHQKYLSKKEKVFLETTPVTKAIDDVLPDKKPSIAKKEELVTETPKDVSSEEKNDEKIPKILKIVSNERFENQMTPVEKSKITEIKYKKYVGKEYRVDYKWLNVRKGPGLHYEKTGELNEDDIVKVEHIMNNQWAEIDYQGSKVYVYAKHLSRFHSKSFWGKVREYLEWVKKETVKMLKE